VEKPATQGRVIVCCLLAWRRMEGKGPSVYTWLLLSQTSFISSLLCKQ
jgi:hypothetical protein